MKKTKIKKRTMKKHFFINSFLIVAGLFTNAYASQDGDTKFEGGITQGWRKDALTGSITGPHGKPKKMLKSKYQGINVYDTRLLGKISKDGYFLSGMAGYGVVIDGKWRNFAYMRNPRLGNEKFEFLRSHGKVSGDYTFDSQILIGKDFALGEVLTIAPTVGYGYYKMDLKTKKIKARAFGVKTKFGKLKDRTSWFGPQVGAQAKLALSQSFRITGEYNYLFALQARRDMRVKGTKLNFKEKAHGFGHIGVVGAEYDLTKNLALKLEGELMKFVTNKGKITKPKKSHQRVHELERFAKEVRLSLMYKF